MYIPRTIEKTIPLLSRQFKVVMVSGMRQVGKSTVLTRLAEPSRRSLTLDTEETANAAAQSSIGFFKANPLPVFIDEIQRVPSLFLGVKYEVDRHEEKGLVWLSGSQRFDLMKGVGDSLAGRIYDQQLLPLSLYERFGLGLAQNPYLPSMDVSTNLAPMPSAELWKTIWQGAWPDVIHVDAQARERYFESFIKTFIDKDVRETNNVEKTRAFDIFLRTLALRTGQELRIGAVAAATGISEITAKRWLSVAEASGIIYLLPPYFTNAGKTLVKSPKVYFTDTGLAAYLCDMTTPQELQKVHAGAFFETFVVMEILKSWVHNGLSPRFYFYRDARSQSEIDLIIHRNGTYYPIEIKSSSKPTIDMSRHFSELKKLGLNVGQGAVICNCEQPRYLSDTVVAHSVCNL